jgi:hypothetical protein
MADSTAAGDAIASRCEPIRIVEQDDGFHVVVAGTEAREFVTNEVGRYVLDLCDGRRTRDEIVATAIERYACFPAGRVRHAVTRFLSAVTNIGVVSWKRPRAGR